MDFNLYSYRAQNKRSYMRKLSAVFIYDITLRFTQMHLQFPNLHSRIYVINYASAFIWDIPVCSFACKIYCLLHLSQFYLIIVSLPRIICCVNIYYTAHYLHTTYYTVRPRLRCFILNRNFIAMKPYSSINSL